MEARPVDGVTLYHNLAERETADLLAHACRKSLATIQSNLIATRWWAGDQDVAGLVHKTTIHSQQPDNLLCFLW